MRVSWTPQPATVAIARAWRTTFWTVMTPKQGVTLFWCQTMGAVWCAICSNHACAVVDISRSVVTRTARNIAAEAAGNSRRGYPPAVCAPSSNCGATIFEPRRSNFCDDRDCGGAGDARPIPPIELKRERTASTDAQSRSHETGSECVVGPGKPCKRLRTAFFTTFADRWYGADGVVWLAVAGTTLVALAAPL